MAFEKVLLEVDADTRKLKASFVGASKTVDDFGKKTEASGNKAAKGFTKADNAAQKLEKNVQKVRATLAGTFVVAGLVKVAGAVIRTSDSVREMDARLKVATVSTKEFNAAQDETKRIANRTFSAVSDTVDLYSRLSLALKGTGTAQRDVFQVTETINKAFAVSGSSAIEASNAIRQLSQSMSAGVLRGDEYRSVTEQGSRIVTVLGDSLGKTRGELKKMADAGELSSEIVIKALLEQSAVIDKEFSQFPVTVSRAITLMSNSWTEYIANSKSAASISQTVSEAIQFLARNIEIIIDTALTLTKVIIALASAKVLGALTASFKASSVAATGAATGYLAYGSAAKSAAVSVGLLGKVSKGVFGFLKSNALGIAIFGGFELISFISSLVSEMETIPTTVETIDTAFAEGISLASLEAAGAQLANVKTEIVDLNVELEKTKGFRGVSDDAKDLQANVYAAAFGVKALEKNLEDANYAATKASFAKTLAQGIKTATVVIDAFKKGIADNTAEIEKQNASLDKWLASQIKSTLSLKLQNDAFGKGKAALVRLQGEQKKAGVTSKKYRAEIDKVTEAKIKQIERNEELREGEKQIAADYALVTDALETYRNALDPIREAEIERAELFAAAGKALAAGTISEAEFTEAIKAGNAALEAAQAELDGFAARVRTADDVLDDLGFTNRAAEADIAILAQAVRDAITDGDLVKAEKYAKALEKISNNADKAAESLTGVNSQTGGFGELDGAFQAILSNIGGSLTDTVNDVGRALVNQARQNPDGPNSGTLGAVGIGLAGIGGFLDAQAAGIDDAGSVLRGVQSALALIPGWGQAIAAISEVLDQLTGGKLFGTAYETTGGSSSATIGAGGVGGGSITNQSRQRSLFRGTQRREITADLSAEVLNALEGILDAAVIGVTNLSNSLGVDVPEIIAGAFNQTFDKDGNLTREFTEILGRQYDETFADFGLRVLAENLIGVLGTTLAGADTSGLANQFRDQGADALLDFAQLASLAVADIQAGNALLSTLAENLSTVQELQKPGEKLAETYLRVQAATNLLDEALVIMNQSLGLSRSEYVAFAAEVSEAAGGLDRATGLWRTFFQGFYSPQELANIQVGQAATASTDALAAVGLGPNTSVEDFRTAFEAVFSSLTPAEVVTWLEAGEALVVYNSALEVQTEILNKSLAAFDSFRNGMRGVNEDIQGLLGSDFQNSLAAIQRQETQTINTLNQLAVAAGRAGLSESELGRIHLRTALQTEQAIAQLRQAAASLIDELYGSQIDERIAELEALQTAGVTNVGNAAENAYERQLALINRIRDVVDSTRLDATLSTLTRREQLDEGVSQFQELLALAQGGDTDALAQLPALYQQLLGIGRDVFASGQGYEDLYNLLTSGLEGLDVTGSPSTNPTVDIAPSAELVALYEARDARNAELETSHRLGLATQLTQHLNDLAAALNTPILALAESMGVDISNLVSDLGVNLEDLTVDTALALANISNSLGVELVDLADNLGVALGALSDTQSLLNDALETRISELPDGMRDQLEPLLRAVENAADGTERDAALSVLERSALALPIAQRNALAPFFDNINPVSELQEQINIAGRQETILELQRNLMTSQLTTLQDIRGLLGGAGAPTPPPVGPFPPTGPTPPPPIETPPPISGPGFGGPISGPFPNNDGIIQAVNNLADITEAVGEQTNGNLSDISTDTGLFNKQPRAIDQSFLSVN